MPDDTLPQKIYAYVVRAGVDTVEELAGNLGAGTPELVNAMVVSGYLQRAGDGRLSPGSKEFQPHMAAQINAQALPQQRRPQERGTDQPRPAGPVGVPPGYQPGSKAPTPPPAAAGPSPEQVRDIRRPAIASMSDMFLTVKDIHRAYESGDADADAALDSILGHLTKIAKACGLEPMGDDYGVEPYDPQRHGDQPDRAAGDTGDLVFILRPGSQWAHPAGTIPIDQAQTAAYSDRTGAYMVGTADDIQFKGAGDQKWLWFDDSSSWQPRGFGEPGAEEWVEVSELQECQPVEGAKRPCPRGGQGCDGHLIWLDDQPGSDPGIYHVAGDEDLIISIPED